LSILSSPPDDEYGNWFKIKGKTRVLSPNAEKSMLSRAVSADV
jgi:hypothetical protein